MEQAPEARVGLAFDGVNSDRAAFEGKAFESGRHTGFECAERSHEAAIGRAIEELRDGFSGGRKGEGVEVLAMLDILIHVFDNVLRKRRSKDAAVAESTMSEFGASLEPSHNFVSQEELCDFREKRLFSRGVFVDDFTVVKDRFDFRRGESGAEVKMRQRLPSGTAEALPGEERRAQGRAGIAGHGLRINVLEHAAGFEGTDEENVQEQAAGNAQRVDRVFFAVALGDSENNFLEDFAGAARERGAQLWIGGNVLLIEFRIAEEFCGEGSTFLRLPAEIAGVQDRQASRVPLEDLSKGGSEIGFAVLAQPLHFMFIAARAETKELGDAGIKPAKRIGKTERLEEMKLVAFAEVKRAGAHVAEFIEGQHQSAFERRSKVGAGGVAEMMLEEQEGSGCAIETANQTELSGLSKIPAERMGPSRAGTGKGALETKPGLAQGGDGETARESGELNIGDSCVALLETAGNRETGNPTHTGRAAKLFFFNGGNDGGFVHEDGRRVAAKTPDAKSKHRVRVPRF